MLAKAGQTAGLNWLKCLGDLWVPGPGGGVTKIKLMTNYFFETMI